MTRAQTLKKDKPIAPLKTPPAIDAGIGVDNFKEEQISDETLKTYFDHAKAGRTISLKGGNRAEYTMKKDLLYRTFHSRKQRSVQQLIVPKNLRQKVMKLAHESILASHLGIQKTCDKVMSNFFWPGIQGDITRFCRSCDQCQKTVPKGRVTRVPLDNMPLIDTPFQRVAIDLVGPISPVTDSGNRYILTMVDYATRYPEAIALPKIETERIAEALITLFSRVGIPAEILSDRGSQFTSELMKEVSRLLGIKQLMTTPYHPQCNGLVEKFHFILKSMLRKLCSERPKDWDRYLPAILFAYREVPQSSLGFSPFELLYGRTVRGPMTILKELWSNETDSPEIKTTYQYIVDLRERLDETCKLAQNELSKSQVKGKKYFDRKAKPRKFNAGDQVLVLLPMESNKLLVKWQGPFKVEEVLKNNGYRVKANGKVKTYHANLLKLYTTRNPAVCAQADVVIHEDSHLQIQDDSVLAKAAVSVIEHETEIGTIDDNELLDFSGTEPTETHKDIHVNEALSSEQKVDVEKLLEEFKDIFTDVPGTTNLAEHVIEVTTDQAVRSKPIQYLTLCRKPLMKKSKRC